MASTVLVETQHFPQNDFYDNHGSPTSNTSCLLLLSRTAAEDDSGSCSTTTFELAVAESKLQATFAEQTALEMKELMDYWRATTVNTTSPKRLTTATCNRMPRNSLTALAEDEEAATVSSITKNYQDDDDSNDEGDTHDHNNNEHNDAVAAAPYSWLVEPQQQQQQQSASQMPAHNVLRSREREFSISSSNLRCETTNLLPEDEEDLDDHCSVEFSFSLHNRNGEKQQRCCDNDASTTTASTYTMHNSGYSCDTSTSESACTCASCCQHQLVPFPPLLSTTTANTCISAADFWSNDNHSILTPPLGADYPPVILLPPQWNVASGASSPCCSSSFAVEHFHWTACQQQTQVNLACSRAQCMADSLAALLVNNNHHERSIPAAATCSNGAATTQRPLLLLLQRLWKRARLLLRRACGCIATELYIAFCRALPLEYFRLWVYLWRLRHSYLLSKVADNNNNTKNAGTSGNHHRLAKKTLKRNLIVTSLVMLVIAVRRSRLQSSLQHQPPHDGDTSPCLVCLQRDDTLPSLHAPCVPASVLPFRTLYFESMRYSSGLSPPSPDLNDLLTI